MKNINEEAEKLSHEEKNMNQNNNENELNMINQETKIDVTPHDENQPNRKFHFTMSNDNLHQMRMRQNMNSEMTGMNHLHHQHQHQHQNQNDFSNPKYLYYYVLNVLQYVNHRIQRTFSSLTNSLDTTLQTSKLNTFLKGYIHSKQIFLVIYIFNIQYLLSVVDKITFLNFLNQNTNTFMILSVIILYVHYYFFRKKLFVEKDEELEKFILKRNPQIKKGRCEECNIFKTMRSNHCFFCNKCVKKFHLHSDWFNICIGANNELLYAIALFFIDLYFFISNIIFWYYILIRSDLLSYLSFVFVIFAVVGIYITFISGKFLYQFILECLFINLTYYEKLNQRRLTYLFGANGQRNFFNPFNKGIQRNLEEMLINMFDIDIYSKYKNFNNQNLSEIIEENDSNTNNEEEKFDMFNDINNFKLMIKLVEHFDPFITSKGNIHKFVDGKEIINWNRLYLYTVFEVINSPFKDMLLKQAKFVLEQNEAFMREQNNKINNEKKEDEKIDEKENKEENKKQIENNEENKEEIDVKENEEKNLIKNENEE